MLVPLLVQSAAVGDNSMSILLTPDKVIVPDHLWVLLSNGTVQYGLVLSLVQIPPLLAIIVRELWSHRLPSQVPRIWIVEP